MPIGSVRLMNEPRMSSSSSRLPRAFSHPAYWVALALLLLNDHVWKGAGFVLAPAWLTGKLSDFAGLLVAPPLLALLMWGLPAARDSRLPALLAPVLVGIGFTAIKVDATAAQLAEQLFGLLGVPSRICVDPTDLFALVVLPFAAGLCRPARFRAYGPGLSTLRIPIIAIAAFACIATAEDNEEGGSASEVPELVNETEEALIVHIASTNGAGGCRIYREDRVGVLTAAAFSLRREVVLEKGARASLTGDLAVPHNNECGAAWVTLPSS